MLFRSFSTLSRLDSIFSLVMLGSFSRAISLVSFQIFPAMSALTVLGLRTIRISNVVPLGRYYLGGRLCALTSVA